MLTRVLSVFRGRQQRRNGRLLSSQPTLESLEDRTLPATTFIQTNLISDVAGLAQFTDPNVRNPWGVAVNPTGDFWIANAGSGTVTLYKGDVNGSPISRDTPIITTPIDPNNMQVLPSGQVFNATRGFVVTTPGFNGPAPFIVAGLDGTLTAIAPTFPGTAYVTTPQYQAQLVAVTQGAVYTGLALASNSSGNFLYAANVTGHRIDVFNSSFQLVAMPGGFVDPTLPAGYSPFNVAAINGRLFVTYKNVSRPDVGGAVDEFDTNGNYLGRFATDGSLNAPWAVVQAPAGFGSFGNDILVGNFGDGRINAYDPTTGAFLGQLTGQNGQPVAIERLWQLTFGNGKTAGNTGTLYFTAGINAQKDGLFGSVQPTTNIPSGPAFVNQVYLTLLQRPADPGGLAFWTNLQNNGVSRQQIVTAIESSNEFRALEVNSLYLRLLHRPADQGGIAFWSARLAREVSIEQIASGIAGSQEYFQSRGAGSVAGFLTALYQDALGRAADTGGMAWFTASLQNGATRDQVAAAIFASDEFRADLIQGFYVSLLHRNPETSALAYWVATMKNGMGDQGVIAAIMGSNEFFVNLGGQSSTTSTQNPGGGSPGGPFYW